MAVLLVFTIIDEPEFDNNQCEKHALQQISESSDSIVALEADCSVLEWIKIDKPQKSGLQSELLLMWNITNERKYYS